MPSSWGPYPDTVLHFPGAALRIDLRRPVSAEARRALATLGLRGAFAVVTAANPLGRPLDPSSNRRLGTLLRAVILMRHPGAVEVSGESPDGRHREAGFALSGGLDEAQALAGRFFQDALFWYDGERFCIVPVLASGPVLPLPDEP